MEQEAGAAMAMAALEMASSGDRGRSLVAFVRPDRAGGGGSNSNGSTGSGVQWRPRALTCGSALEFGRSPGICRALLYLIEHSWWRCLYHYVAGSADPQPVGEKGAASPCVCFANQ